MWFAATCSTAIDIIAAVMVLVDAGFVIAGQRQFLSPGILCVVGLLMKWCSK